MRAGAPPAKNRGIEEVPEPLWEILISWNANEGVSGRLVLELGNFTEGFTAVWEILPRKPARMAEAVSRKKKVISWKKQIQGVNIPDVR